MDLSGNGRFKVGDFGSGLKKKQCWQLEPRFGAITHFKVKAAHSCPAFGARFVRTVRNFLIHCPLSFK